MATIEIKGDKRIIRLSNEDIVEAPLAITAPYKPKPSIIYHYTSIDTFQKILKSKSLRFTNLRDLNDTSEFYYGLRLLLDKITRYEIKRGISLQYRIPHDFIKTLFLDYSKNLYASCFTENGDNIVFWNSLYIKPNNAVAIGFDTNKLQTEKCKLRFCIYGEPPLHELDEEVYGMLLRLYKHPYTIQNDSNFLQTTFNPAYIKHKGFESEEEWRLVSVPHEGVKTGTFNRGNKLCHFFDSPIDLNDMVKLVVGPGEEQFRNLDLVYTEARLNGVSAVIDYSRIPYNP